MSSTGFSDADHLNNRLLGNVAGVPDDNLVATATTRRWQQFGAYGSCARTLVPPAIIDYPRFRNVLRFMLEPRTRS